MIAELIRIAREIFEAVRVERERRNAERMLAELHKMGLAADQLAARIAALKRAGKL